MASSTYSLATRVKLATGQTMPQIQLGLEMMSGREATRTVTWALEAGYRAFNCAQEYNNEREAGKAITAFLAKNTDGLTREDIHYTTKLASCSKDYGAVRHSIKQSVTVCGLGYVDLMLLHSPYAGREARLTSWRALEDAVKAGDVKMAGVSNYGIRHITELMASNPKIHPVINQIRVHPFRTPKESFRKTCARHNIVVEAYAPLGHMDRSWVRHPTIIDLAAKYACTPAQLLVRWSLQHGMITLPNHWKSSVTRERLSVRRERLVENVEVNGFEISAADVGVMNARWYG